MPLGLPAGLDDAQGGRWVQRRLSGGVGQRWARPDDAINHDRYPFGNLDTFFAEKHTQLPLLLTSASGGDIANLSGAKDDWAAWGEMRGDDGVWRLYLVKGNRCFYISSAAPGTLTEMTDSPIATLPSPGSATPQGRLLKQMEMKVIHFMGSVQSEGVEGRPRGPRRRQEEGGGRGQDRGRSLIRDIDVLAWACGEGSRPYYISSAEPTTLREWAEAGDPPPSTRIHLFWKQRVSFSGGVLKAHALFGLTAAGTLEGRQQTTGRDPSGTNIGTGAAPGEIVRATRTIPAYGWAAGLPVNRRIFIEPAAKVGAQPILLGVLDSEDQDEVYIALEDIVWVWNWSLMEPKRLFLGLGTLRGGGIWRDWVVVCGRDEIVLFNKGRPKRPIGPWMLDGVPADWSGEFKSCYIAGEYIIALWEFDSGALSGNSVELWGRYEPSGRWVWHPRTATLTGGATLSGNSQMFFSDNMVTGKRRLYTVTADGSTGRVYYQDHPHPGWDPLNDTSLSYEAGPLYAYLPWLSIASAGPGQALFQDVAADASVSATEKLLADYRVDHDPAAEIGATWSDIIIYDNAASQRQHVEGGVARAAAVQNRLGMQRGGGATTTPVLREWYERYELRQAST